MGRKGQGAHLSPAPRFRKTAIRAIALPPLRTRPDNASATPRRTYFESLPGCPLDSQTVYRRSGAKTIGRHRGVAARRPTDPYVDAADEKYYRQVIYSRQYAQLRAHFRHCRRGDGACFAEGTQQPEHPTSADECHDGCDQPGCCVPREPAGARYNRSQRANQCCDGHQGKGHTGERAQDGGWHKIRSRASCTNVGQRHGDKY